MAHLRRMTVLLVVAVTAGASGCGPVCDGARLCAVDGAGTAITVCDGHDFRRCDASDRGLTLSCAQAERRAVCTPSGWTFENTGAPATP